MPFKAEEPLKFRTPVRYLVVSMLEEGRTDSEIAAALNNPVSPLILQEFETSKARSVEGQARPRCSGYPEARTLQGAGLDQYSRKGEGC